MGNTKNRATSLVSQMNWDKLAFVAHVDVNAIGLIS